MLNYGAFRNSLLTRDDDAEKRGKEKGEKTSSKK